MSRIASLERKEKTYFSGRQRSERFLKLEFLRNDAWNKEDKMINLVKGILSLK